MGRSMTARKTLRCDCGHEAVADDEWTLVDAVRAHAREAHGFDLPVSVALALVSGSPFRSSAEAKQATHVEKGSERQ